MFNSKRTDFKARRRKWEFFLISAAMERVIPKEKIGRLRVLEFGSGPSGGAEFLVDLGYLVVTDVYKHPLLRLPLNVKFKIADIHKTDFKEGEFDVLVSNQVIEHLEKLDEAFVEMKRIAKPDAYFVFGVPTAVWLLLTIPGQIFRKFENIYSRISGKSPKETSSDTAQNAIYENKQKQRWSRFVLKGHGCYHGFFECLKMFMVNNWRRILILNGFKIISSEPLLCYGSSHLPIVPTNRILAKMGLSSSYLFICRKA
jgi:SAM-dependent methyltransferase